MGALTPRLGTPSIKELFLVSPVLQLASSISAQLSHLPHFPEDFNIPERTVMNLFHSAGLYCTKWGGEGTSDRDS